MTSEIFSLFGGLIIASAIILLIFLNEEISIKYGHLIKKWFFGISILLGAFFIALTIFSIGGFIH
jgi:hypothetical protein